MGASWADHKLKKIIIILKLSNKLSSLILHDNNEPFLDQIVTCNEKWILYNNLQWPAQWLDRENAPKLFPKPNLHQRKVMVTGSLLLLWSTTAFWILVKPWHLRSMLSRSMRCTKNCNACSCHWSNSSKKGPNSSPRQCPTCTISASELGYEVFLHLPYSLDFSPTWFPVLKAPFCRENASTTSRRQKMLSKSLLNPEAWIFMLQE